MAVSVGIDLGTTYSAVAYVPEGANFPQIILNSEGRKITPSIIQFNGNRIVFGSEAESAFAVGSEGCVATFKRSMGNDDPYCVIDGKSYTATDLSTILLRHLKEETEQELGDTIQDAVITVPAYFYSTEREATIKAAEKAGIKVRKIIDEPNAAAMAYGLNHWRENANILVYDLGGGTFDVTLTRMEEGGVLRTIVTRGNHILGGRDWDDRMEMILTKKLSNETGLELEDNDSKRIIRGLCEDTKKKLSAMRETVVKVSVPNYGYASVFVSRAEFETNTADLIERTGVLCRAIIEEADLRLSDVTDILLVGGSTRMPQVSDYLTRLFNKKPITHINPDEAVALGAAIQTTKENNTYTKLSVVVKNGKKETDREKFSAVSVASMKPAHKLNSIGTLKIQETTAHAMGIIAISADGTHYINDVIIPANHPRPVKSAKAFYTRTARGKDTEMEIFVIQGDRENLLDNQIPFRYVVSGIQYVSKRFNQTLIRVQYSYDENGVIHVEARQENDDVNLPIRKERVPEDMAKFAGNVSKDDYDNKKIVTQTGLGIYNEWAGISNIPTTSLDRFGNPEGSGFDLAIDGSFKDYKVLILNLCESPGASLYGVQNALQKKGFEVQIFSPDVPAPNFLEELLKNMSQLWIISQQDLRFNDEHYRVIKKFFDDGHGIYIWGDNDPLNTNANYFVQKLFNSFLSGDYYAQQVLGIQEMPGAPGIIENHLISTGIMSFFEGNSIAQVNISGGLEPLIYSSDRNVVTAFYDQNGKRALVDGAFTRLWDGDWGQSAGTERYITNAAAWLVNLERFAESFGLKSFDKSNDEDDYREVETWD